MAPRLAGLLLVGLLFTPQAHGEPYFAVQEGMKCANCHVNPGGGGMRNTFGNIWAQNSLPADQIDSDVGPWTGMLNNYVAIGANLRANAAYTDIPNQDNLLDFEHQETRLYLQFSPVPERLSLYIDQRLGPGGGRNLEAYGRYWSESRDWYVMAGEMYLPYGLRIEDDSAFVRQASGINFTSPDRGVALGWELPRWSIQTAVSEGADALRGKQFSLRAEHVVADWRAGASLNFNDTDEGGRQMQNVFAGIRTGPIAWLGEINYISDDSLPDRVDQWAALLEANWLMRQGHNLKITAEYLDPDTDLSSNERYRYSLVWEYSPFQFTQLRVGTRFYDGPSAIDLENRTRLFVQFHSFF
jgi:hypothetical protein